MIFLSCCKLEGIMEKRVENRNSFMSITTCQSSRNQMGIVCCEFYNTYIFCLKIICEFKLINNYQKDIY